MRGLMILIATTAVVSGHREATPGFAVDFRNFGGSRLYQDLPYREQPRSFRETGPAPGQHQTYRPESFRDYRPSFSARDEGRTFRDEGRGGFKDEDRAGFKEELRTYSDEARPFRDEARLFKDEGRFREDLRAFRDERVFRDDARGIREGPRPFREESRPFREEIRHFRESSYRDEPRPFREETRTFEGPRHYREEIRPFRNDVRPFREEPTGFREERPFREESGPLRNEPRPFREESRPFKDEILFTQESQTLAEAQHRFNKEHQHRQPLSFGGHSNYLKYGNHGLGYASIPSAILPLEDHPPRMPSSMGISDLSTTASTQAPNFLEHAIQSSPPASESTITASHIAVTRAPDVGATPSVEPQSGNTISHSTNQQQTNENLVDGGATNPTSSGVTIPTSGGTSVTPKMLFTSGGPAMSHSPMGINGVDADIGVQQAHGAASNSLHASKQETNGVSSPSSYFPSDTRPEVPEALLNYVFKYRIPEDAKVRYTFRNSLQPESFNQIQAVPLIHQHGHQTAKYTVLPELKIAGLPAMQPGPTVNYVASPDVQKVSYLSPNSQGLEISGGYTPGNVPPVNFAGNLIQLERETRFTPLGQAGQMAGAQANQYSQLGQISSGEYLTQLAQYGNLGQAQATGVPFGQGLPLQLGGFGGIDYNSLSSNSEAARGAAPMSLELTDPSRPPGGTFSKISFGDSIWRL
ncbi:uncharacterized protein [Venturia canescens]|uniref:uncharacterized protein isoform X2 n=1 Tax=Venturia canescens TaxID=32260 RepID=UPI001C9C4063|nr:uncharacterized protein LOC122417972 isoform X2 [Venturia canescens]